MSDINITEQLKLGEDLKIKLIEARKQSDKLKKVVDALTDAGLPLPAAEQKRLDYVNNAMKSLLDNFS